jgi:Mor family transcriptional regulator
VRRPDVHGRAAEIVDLFDNGFSVTLLAAKFNCGESLIRIILARHKPDYAPVPRRRRDDVRAKSTEIVRLYKSGKSIRALAKQYHCSASLMRTVLLERKVLRIRNGSQGQTSHGCPRADP